MAIRSFATAVPVPQLGCAPTAAQGSLPFRSSCPVQIGG